MKLRDAREGSQKTTPSHITIKLLKTKDKDNFESSQRKKGITQNPGNIL